MSDLTKTTIICTWPECTVTETHQHLTGSSAMAVQLSAQEKQIVSLQSQLETARLESSRAITVLSEEVKILAEKGIALTDENVALTAQLEAVKSQLEDIDAGRLKYWKDRTLDEEIRCLRQFWEDTTNPASDWPCLPECDSYGHSDGCPHVEPAYAFRRMLEQLEAAKRENERLLEVERQREESLRKIQGEVLVEARVEVDEEFRLKGEIFSLQQQLATLTASLASMEAERDALKQQAQIHAQEARTANSTIAEIYQAVTGSTGEPGNWNGAVPVKEKLAKLREACEAAESITTTLTTEFTVEHMNVVSSDGCLGTKVLQLQAKLKAAMKKGE